MHQDRGPLLLRQQRDRVPDFLQPGLIHHPLLHRRPPVGDLAGRHFAVPVVVEPLLPSFVPPVPQPVQRQMRGDPEQPRRESRRWLICSPGTINPQENFLRQFLRYCLILHHPVHEMDHRVPVLFEQDTETLLVALPDPEHQLGIQIERRRSPHNVLTP